MKVILWKILIYKKFLVIMLASLPACQLASLPACQLIILLLKS